MKIGPRLSRLGAAMLLTSALSACGDGDAKSSVPEDCVPAHEGLETIKDGVLQIGVSDAPPLISTTGDKGYSGVDADVIDGFAAAECLEVEPHVASATTQVPGVEQRRWDTSLGGWYRSTEREKVVSMGAPLYLDQIIIVSNDGLTIFDDLEGKKVGVVEGFTFTDDLRKLVGEGLKTYAGTPQVVQDFKAGRLDAAVDLASVTASYPKDVDIEVPEGDARIPASEKPAQCSVPFNKNAAALREAFDEYVAKTQTDGKIAEILEKHGLDPALADIGSPYFI